MSNDKPPKPKRSFRIIFRFIKFVIAMVLTFCISFAVTLYMKSDHPADYFSSFADEIFSDEAEEEIKSRGVPEIKTLFDEHNKQPFDPSKYNDANKHVDTNTHDGTDKRVDTNKHDEPNKRVSNDIPEPLRQEEEIGFFASLERMTSIKTAVDEKIKHIPHYVTINNLPHLLQQAVVAVEDNRFYKHKGFDIIGIARAILVNVEAGEIQEGASTITQQTVKNLFLTSDQTFTRKAEELILSMNMEDNFDKDKILEIYLNVIYFGSNFYGIYDASQGYFGKEPADLTIAECAMLAGLPNAPSLYSPYVDFHLAKQRQLVVIDAMERMGIISKTEAESARIEEIILAH